MSVSADGASVAVADQWQDRIDRLMDLDRRLRLIERYVAVIEERVEQDERGEIPGPRLHLVRGEEPLR